MGILFFIGLITNAFDINSSIKTDDKKRSSSHTNIGRNLNEKYKNVAEARQYDTHATRIYMYELCNQGFNENRKFVRHTNDEKVLKTREEEMRSYTNKLEKAKISKERKVVFVDVNKTSKQKFERYKKRGYYAISD